MRYVYYKLSFSTALHIGKKLLSDSEYHITADTICSALCHEALKCGGQDILEKFIGYIKEGRILLSDAMPFKNSELYIPKPYVRPNIDEKQQGDSVRKKAFKKLKYIPISMLDMYISGNMEPTNVDNDFGISDVHTKVKIDRNGKDSEPYSVGVFSFRNNCGLYIVVGYEEEQNDKYHIMIDNLMKSLSYTGIGGKVYSGYGKFCCDSFEVSKEYVRKIEDDYKVYMTLSLSLPKETEADVVNENACYMIEKRSGFVQSETYSDIFVKKNDFYAFAAGSCFDKRYKGDVYDVSGEGTHPVYKYAKPIMIGVI